VRDYQLLFTIKLDCNLKHSDGSDALIEAENYREASEKGLLILKERLWPYAEVVGKDNRLANHAEIVEWELIECDPDGSIVPVLEE